MTVRFDEVLPIIAQALATHVRETAIAVRDILGRVTLYLRDPTDGELNELAASLKKALGPWLAGVHSIADSIVPLQELERSGTRAPAVMGLMVVDRRAMAPEWEKIPRIDEGKRPPRIAFYGIKGGVGRSTALAVTAAALAQVGVKVLTVDLDLEAPGLGSLLLDTQLTPQFGIVDWLAEDAIENVDRRLIVDSLGRSSLAASKNLYVAPAFGSQSLEHYPDGLLSKLARAYVSVLRNGKAEGFVDRVKRLLEDLEAEVNPDVVLIDCRAGLSEISAAPLLHLGAEAYLFASNTEQTWADYRCLLGHFRKLVLSEQDRDWRYRFKMVYARAPSDGAKYEQFIDRAYRLWEETLYDEVAPGGELGFHFDRGDVTAPHYAHVVLADPRFDEFDPTKNNSILSGDVYESAFGGFVRAIRERYELIK